jgi:carbon monoxide dehydrogenase subunit G
MASEKFNRSVTVPLSKSAAWMAITDVSQLAAWVGIIEEVRELSHLEKYRAVLHDRVGPFKLRADLSIDVSVPVDGERVLVKASGRDRAVDSKISVNVAVELAELDEGGTSISVEGSYQVTGRVASMGGGVIKKKGEGVLTDFFDGVQRDLC